MAVEARPDGFQVGENPTLERRVWVFERTGWAVMALLLVATAAGLFGSSGLLPPVTARSADGLEVRYSRFQRHAAKTELQVTIPAQVESVQFWLSRPFIESYEILLISPEPETAQTSLDRVVYTFRAQSPGEPAAVTFTLEPARYGRYTGAAGLGEDGPPLRIRPFVYP